MSPRWRWITLALSLTLIGGASLGIVADRVLLEEHPAEVRSSGRSDGTIWFDCARTRGAEGQREREAGDDENEQAEHRKWHSRRFESMRQELRLDDEQVVAVQETFDQHRALARVFWRETRDEYCFMRERLRDDLRSLLDADQQELFERRLERVDARERERMSSLRGANDRRRKDDGR